MKSRFVGRIRELEVAEKALAGAAAGSGSVVTIVGDAGIGKSRLAHEIVARARRQGMETAWGAGWPGGGAPAYWPWPELLATSDSLAAGALDLGSGAPDAERFERFRAVGEALRRRAAVRPLVVVLDDAHSIDPDGLVLTRFVARGLVDYGLVLVVTHRAAPAVGPEHAAVLADLDREATVLHLSGFEPSEISDIVAAHGEAADTPVVARVHALTGGNPYLIEQVLDAGVHHRDRPPPGAALRVLDAQLDVLDPTTRHVLETAAVLGRAAAPPEIASVAEVDPVMVERARDEAGRAGIVRPERREPFAFSHDLAREAVLAHMSQDRLAELHRRAATLFVTDGHLPERALQHAHHALALAYCSIDETTGAVATARSSARTLLEHGAPEAAVELLRQALALQETTGSDPAAPLVTELGYALLTTGRLADARELFRHAVATADAAGDTLTYARAALGLGGVWVNDHRGAEENRAYRDILDRAIDGISRDSSREAQQLAASLRLRRAAERAAVEAGADEDVVAALESVRAEGDAHALAAGLSLVHHLMLGPEHAEARVPVACELLDVARSCGDELLTLMGLMWSAVDALLLGDDAERALSELRERAEALGMRAILFMSDAIDVMQMMRAGELVRAEAAARACLERGLEVGDPDATNYYGSHLLALRWYAGRAAELLGLAQDMASSTTVPDHNPVLFSVIATLAADAGDTDLAEKSLSRLGRGRLDHLMPTSSWLTTMFAVTEAAVSLHDAELAGEVYELLAPYASLPVMSSIGIGCFGSAERSLGLAAGVTGRIDAAVAHLEGAVTENRRLGNRPMTAIARADLAAALLQRGRSGDRPRAAELVNTAIDAAERMDLDGRLRAWKQLRERIEAPEVTATARCIRRGSTWELSSSAARARVPHTVGMGYLAALLAAPRTEFSAGELAGVDLVSPSQDVLDPAAVQALRRRVGELEDQIDAATRAGHDDQVDVLRDELDEIVAHARSATGLGGRSRLFDDAAERARTSVQKAIRRAIANIDRDAPRLGAALTASVRTGHRCSYEPGPDAPEHWDVRTG